MGNSILPSVVTLSRCPELVEGEVEGRGNSTEPMLQTTFIDVATKNSSIFVLMEKQQVHTDLQWIIVMVALLPLILVPIVLERSWDVTNATFITFNIIVLIVFELIAFMQLRPLRKVWFDHSGIYIRPLLRDKEEKISFSDVHRLRDEIMTIVRLPGGQQFSLTYNSADGIKTIKFFGSVYEKRIKELRKYLSDMQNL